MNESLNGPVNDPLADPAATLETYPDLPHAPATARNREVIATELARLLAPWPSPRVLEVASGSGEHGLWFCRQMPNLDWQPTDRTPEILTGIERWRTLCPDLLDRHQPPALLDVMVSPWSLQTAPVVETAALSDTAFTAVFAANLTHISPWPVTEALIAGAATAVAPGGLLMIYGPFNEDGKATGPGNERFELWLKERDPRFGIRDRAEVIESAEAAGFTHQETVMMPADNRILVLRR